MRHSVLLLGNDARAEPIYPEAVELMFGPTDFPEWWTYAELFDD